jgi:hypothetical protein
MARGMTGCQFAALIAQDPKRIFAVSFHELASEANVSRVFEAAAQAHLPAVAAFTGIKTEDELVEQLRILGRGSRWTITRERPAGLVTNDVLIGIHWQIRDGLSSSVMGLAPFATMPVTRRAPYVCLAAWPGGHDNPHWTRYEQDLVHFLDTDLSALQLTPTKYRSLTEASKTASEHLLHELDDHARYYRRAAFRLHSSTATALRDITGDS